MRRFEFKEGSSNKFWEVTVSGNTLTMCFGRVGSARQENRKHFALLSQFAGICRVLFQLTHLNVASSAFDLRLDMLSAAPKNQVHTCLPDLQIVNSQFVECPRQPWLRQKDGRLGRHDMDSQTRVEHQKDGSCGPGLRSTSDWVESRPAAVRPSVEPAE